MATPVTLTHVAYGRPFQLKAPRMNVSNRAMHHLVLDVPGRRQCWVSNFLAILWVVQAFIICLIRSGCILVHLVCLSAKHNRPEDLRTKPQTALHKLYVYMELKKAWGILSGYRKQPSIYRQSRAVTVWRPCPFPGDQTQPKECAFC